MFATKKELKDLENKQRAMELDIEILKAKLDNVNEKLEEEDYCDDIVEEMENDCNVGEYAGSEVWLYCDDGERERRCDYESYEDDDEIVIRIKK